MGNLNCSWLIVYIIAWAFFLILYKKKHRIFDGGSIIIITYLLYAVLSYLLYKDEDGFAGYFKEIRLFPFVYLFIMYIIAMQPLIRFNPNFVSEIKDPPKNVIRNVSLLFIITSFIGLPGRIRHIKEGLTSILLDAANAGEIYAEKADIISETGHGSLAHLPAVLSSAFYEIGVFLFFYLLIKYNKNNKWILICLGIVIILSVFAALASGSRGTPAGYMLIIIGSYFLFRPFYSKRLNKFFGRVGIFFILLIIIPIGTITIGRFGEGNASSSALYYVGQANLYFNNYGLDDNGIRYGDRTIPLFKRMVGISNVPHNYLERRAKYPGLKINDEVFSTFIGDFTIDFGPVLAFLIVVIASSILSSRSYVKSGGTIHFRQLLLLHLVLCTFMGGGMLYGFSDTGGNLKLIAYLSVYLYSSTRISVNNGSVNELEIKKN